MEYNENAIPSMTSYTTSSGIVTSSGERSGSSAAWMAMDRSESTYWLGSIKGSGWLAYEFLEAKRIEKYSITHPTRGDSELARMPKNWSFQYWDGLSWQSLDIQTDVVWSNAGETKEFSFTNWHSFKKYRINISETGDLSLLPVIAELKMFEEIYHAGLLLKNRDHFVSIAGGHYISINTNSNSEITFAKYGIDFEKESISQVFTMQKLVNNSSSICGSGKVYEHLVKLKKRRIDSIIL